MGGVAEMDFERSEIEQAEPAPAARRRRADQSNVRARAAVAATLERFDDWRRHLAIFEVSAERRSSPDERAAMLAHCARIERELASARTDLLLSLADAPRPVAGHSRVVDVEKALDSIELALARVRRKLG